MIGRRTDRGPEALVVPERMLAGAIDLALFGTIASLLLIPAFVFNYEKTLWPDAVLVGLAYVVYFAGCEFVFQATLGKLLCGLRVYTPDGGRPPLLRIVVRNLARPIDLLPFLYFVGLLFVGSTQRAQRFGDLLGGTVVKGRSPTDAETRHTFFGAVATAFVAWAVPVALVSAFFGWLTWDPAIGVVLFLIGASAGWFLVLLGDDHARYGTLASVIGIGALVGVGLTWTEREHAYIDDRAEIRASVLREIPIGTSEEEALAART